MSVPQLQSVDKWFETNLDVWYDSIVDITFKTRMISLTQDQILAIIIDNEFFNSDTNQELLEETGTDIQSSISSEQKKIALEQLELVVNKEMNQLMTISSHSPPPPHTGDTDESGCFIKLSCRSPKDAFAVCDKMKQIFNSKIEKIVGEKNGSITPNERLITVNESFIQSMKVKNFAEEYSYFRKSARVLEDLLLFLKQEKSYREMNPIKLIIREWVEIPSRYEFRTFVKNKKLTAISQYFDTCFYPELVAESDSIKRKLYDFFRENVAERVPLDDYICDFAIDTNGRVYIVELNPFSTTTDACLFSWTRDGDILNGKNSLNNNNNNTLDEFENIVFRVKKEVEKHLKHQIISVWVPFVIPTLQ